MSLSRASVEWNDLKQKASRSQFDDTTNHTSIWLSVQCLQMVLLLVWVRVRGHRCVYVCVKYECVCTQARLCIVVGLSLQAAWFHVLKWVLAWACAWIYLLMSIHTHLQASHDHEKWSMCRAVRPAPSIKCRCRLAHATRIPPRFQCLSQAKRLPLIFTVRGARWGGFGTFTLLLDPLRLCLSAVTSSRLFFVLCLAHWMASNRLES